jgi:squalene-hopene/tetraprenyl-beta-curcumene cyclase
MIDAQQLTSAYETAVRDLLAWRTEDGHWVGQLSSSALSTATAASALAVVDRHSPDGAGHRELIARAIAWLVRAVNDDGGWGDTDRSRSNIATTMLVRAAFLLAGAAESHRTLLQRADEYIRREGGVAGLVRRYGLDKTFAVPILTNCALAGMTLWSEVAPLPFELACLPHGLLRVLRLPVVSYALPALVAIGQARYFHAPPRNPLVRLLRWAAVEPGLKKLRAMQPASGGYLEATPLTSFVVMSLAATGRAEHPVVRDGVQFLANSAREDGSWPIDVNLATWTTTLALSALPADRDDDERDRLVRWILSCQHRQVHPFTRAASGGWGWTNSSGAVPDADDTAGALLALARLARTEGAVADAGCLDHGETVAQRADLRAFAPLIPGHPVYDGDRAVGDCPLFVGEDGDALANRPDRRKKGTVPLAARRAARDGIDWLLRLQNADGGWPTFCRGWGALPFDRSAPDLTAHAIRALHVWQDVAADGDCPLFVGEESDALANRPDRRKKGTVPLVARKIQRAIDCGLRYLRQAQRADGSWVPLWFGNEREADEENPVYGTARVLLAYRDLGRSSDEPAGRGAEWLCAHQNPDGGWGSHRAGVSSVEETAVAVEALLAAEHGPAVQVALEKGLGWLVRAVAEGRHRESSPIGLYFARLWYYESLYPMVFAVAALRAARERGI